MQVAIIGEGPPANSRAAAVRAHSFAAGVETVVREYPRADDFLDAIPGVDGPDVIFVAGGPQRTDRVTELAQTGSHLFLEWPPALSVSECRALVALAEEAGIEIGVSRPLRSYPWPGGVERLGHVDVVSIRQILDLGSSKAWKRALEDALDLALVFAQGASPRRIDSSLARTERRLPLLTLAGIRFHNGALAHIEVRHTSGVRRSFEVCVAGPGYATDIDFCCAREEGIQRETAEFLGAMDVNRPAPVSVLDALQTLRLVEKLMERLRS